MAVITRGVIHSYGVAMKIIEDTDISTYIRKKLFSVTDTDENKRVYVIQSKKYKQKKIDLDAVNNISKFVDGVEWFMVDSVDRNGDITDDIDPCGLMFDDGIYCVYGTIYLFKTQKQRDYVFRYITTGKNN
jgi:hypothetical protein